MPKRRGRPRKVNPEEGSVAVEDNVEEVEIDMEKHTRVRKISMADTFESVVDDEKKKKEPWSHLVPFEGVDKLPKPKVDTKGKVRQVFKQYYFSGRQLISIYLGREGSVHRVNRHTFHKTAKDREIVRALAKKGIPGAEQLK